MDDRVVQWSRGSYVVSTDRARLDPGQALALLRGTHWGAELSVPLMTRAIANSVAFGLYAGSELVGFGRVVTDLATYGYLTDVVVAEPHRGQGLGRWLTECILAHPELQGFRRLALVTRDAQALYVSLGFQVGAGERTYLERR
jgi:ribosomal protein S18 acetylase RimI-like enzyme